MRNIEEKIKGVAKNMINAMLKKEPREWPPECLALLYQPKRPCVEKAEEKSESR